MGSRIPRTISIAVMAMLILISSCSTASKERFDPRKVADGEILSMIEGYNRLEGAVFMGVSGPYSNMETAYSKAMENAAIMALFNEGIEAGTALQTISSSSFSYGDMLRSARDFDFGEERIMGVLSNAEIISAEYLGGAVGAVVLIRSGSEPLNPGDDGVIVATGTARKYANVQDSLLAATLDAAIQLTMQRSGFAVSDMSREMRNETFREESSQLVASVLDGFTVLSYSYDPESGMYSATAAACVR